MFKKLLFILVVFFLACQNDATKTATDSTNSREVASVASDTVQDAAALNTALHLKPKGEFPVPVYDSFDEIAPVFAVDNDTTYVINFWATWCKPCVAELPYFETLHQKYTDQKVRVLLVSLDFKKMIDHHLKPFMEKKNIQSDVVLLADPKASTWIDRIDTSWSGAIPVTLIYKGNNRHFIASEVADFQELEDAVRKVMQL